VIYPTKSGDSFWRSCVLMSSPAYSKFNLSSDMKRPGSCLHRPLLPFWIQPAHALVNISLFQSIPCLFGCIYDTTTCSEMLATFFHKQFPKIHTDSPRNACGVQTAAGRVSRVINPWSPTQVTIHHYHLVFIMLHITEDSIVQMFLDSCLQSSGTCKYFPMFLQKSQIESTQP
jgi:hypothetical protein